MRLLEYVCTGAERRPSGPFAATLLWPLGVLAVIAAVMLGMISETTIYVDKN